jgi:trigger factor
MSTPENTIGSTLENIGNSLENAAEYVAKKMDLTADIQVISSCERRIKVTIPRAEIEHYFQDEFAGLEKNAYVPGFRIGKAPRKLVEKRFKKDILERVKNALVVDALAQVNSSTELTPISEPDFQYESLILPEEGPFVFEFSVEVRPEFDLPEWKGLTILKPVHEFSKEDVDKAVARLLTNYGELVMKDTPAEPDDYIETMLTFKFGEQILASAEHETVRLRPKLSFHDGFIENFDKLLTGVKPDDVVTVQTQLTNDAANPEFRGKVIDAVFEIIAVKRLVLPVISESFLQRIGNFQNEGDFRDAVLDSLQRQLEHEQRQYARRQITEKLVVTANWELPAGLLKKQSEREFRRVILELQRSGFSQEEIKSHANYLHQNSAGETARALKEHFILEKIAEIENVEATEEDYNTEISLIAAQKNWSPRRVRAHLEKAGEMDILRNQIVERKIIDLICQHATFEETQSNIEEPDSDTIDAIDLAAAGNPSAISEVSAEDLKAVHKEIDEKKKFDPNIKVK